VNRPAKKKAVPAPPWPTDLEHRLLAEVLREGDQVIDATCGNGHDTRFLARCVGPSGRVLAFDVQAAAIGAAARLAEESGLRDRIDFFHESHAGLAERAAPESIAAVMFNLGYLPGADREVTTRPEATLPALEAAARVLRPGGWLCVMAYSGHEGGPEEAAVVEGWMASRADLLWRVARYGMLGTLSPAPVLLLAVKPG